MELKEIKVSDILANFYQPRTKFDRESIKELAESILSNGLINPITITPDKKRKGKYMIVSGERRWQAHKIAKLKTISCVVKEYKSDGQFMVESLIENIHREDLSDSEMVKFGRKIMEIEKIDSIPKLAKRISKPVRTVSTWFQADRLRKSAGVAEKISQSVIVATQGLPEKQRLELIKQASKEDFGSEEMRRRVSEIKAGERPEPIQLERTANDVLGEITSSLDNFRDGVDELLKNTGKQQINLKDLDKESTNNAMTQAGLHLKHFLRYVNNLRKIGARPNPLILKLIKSNGKI